jgi:hypothetical protein
VGRSLWREDGPVVCQTQSAVISPLSVCTYNLHFTSYYMYVYTTYTRPLSVQAQYSRSYPIISSSRYNSSLVTWTVVCLTAAKFKPLILLKKLFQFLSLYSLGAAPRKTPFPNNSSIVIEVCLPRRCGETSVFPAEISLLTRFLAMKVYYGSAIPAIRRHVTVWSAS